MNTVEIERLRSIKTLPSLIKYLRDELEWPIDSDDAEDVTFDFSPEELGIEAEAAYKIKEIRQIRPLTTNQPWGIFWINFEPKRLPVVILRRILSGLVIKKRSSAKRAHQRAWQMNDLLFISLYGESNERAVTFAHFSEIPERSQLPTLRVLEWDDQDTVLHLDHAHQTLKEKLRWPEDDDNIDSWRKKWTDAFALRHRETITTSKELAIQLADIAKKIRKRAKTVLKVESKKGPLRTLHKAFKEALIHDLEEDDFTDMYAQTIAYGLLAARVSRPAGIVPENLKEMIPTTNPFLGEMMDAFLNVGGRKKAIDFDELGIQEIIELLNSPETHMDAILRDFGNRTRQEDPVIHFYELFLSEYDKKMKIQRGVFYTPQPVVSYIVRSVHELLQKEFGLEDGLASTVTWGEMLKKNPELKLPILKPADSSTPDSKDELLSPDEPFVQILDPAVGTATFLVEVIDVIHKTMTAKWQKQGMSYEKQKTAWNEYVPKHLLPRLYGFELLMAPYSIAHMKVGLKLTETGFEWPMGFKGRAHIYLTNSLEPPSDIQYELASIAPALAHEAQAVNLVKRFKRFTVVIGNPPYSFRSTNKSEFITGLLEDYRKGLNEKKPQLNDDYVKFIRLGQFMLSLLPVGVMGMITNNSYLYGVTHWRMRQSLCETFSDISILDLGGDTKFFQPNAVDENVFDIQQGVSIGLFVRQPTKPATIKHYRLLGFREQKYNALAGTAVPRSSFDSLKLHPPFYFTKNLVVSNEDYSNWSSLVEMYPVFVNGIVTSRDAFAIDESESRLKVRVQDFVSLAYHDLLKKYEQLDLKDNTAVKIKTAQQNFRKNPKTFSSCVTRCSFRPFDERFIAFDSNLIHRTREEVMGHMLHDNLGLVFNRSIRGDTPCHFFVARHVVMKELISSKDNCYVAPLFLYDHENSLLPREAGRIPNLGQKVNAWLHEITAQNVPNQFLHYAYAVFHSPGYRSRYAEFLKIDFPRLPLTSSLELFRALAKLGGELVALHLMESSKLNNPITKFVGDAKTEIEKVIYSDQTVWIDKANTTGFKSVPENVWNFHIGGYQVCEKWLKDRKGRKLSKDDIDHYQKIVVALSETIRLMTEIDKVIDAHGGWPDAFATGKNKQPSNDETKLDLKL